MINRVILSVGGISLAIASCSTDEKPNLVLFMADDCSYYDLGCYGGVNIKTPNIDRFAAEGIRFTNAFQSAPMSSPTRHNLYTGLWPVKTGAHPNHTTVSEGTLSIVQHLKPAGYMLALIGKSHVQPESVFAWDFEAPLTKSNDIDFAAVDSFMKACIKLRKPFCLFVMSNQPHTPWNKGNPELLDPDKVELPPFYVDIPETRKDFCRYLAEIGFMDEEFGTLLGKIDNHGIKDNTAVVYLSEQGNSFPFAKWTCYNAGVHSACIVRWPGKIKPGTTSDAIVEYIDILPTFLEMAGTAPAGELDGKSFVPVLTGKTAEHKQYTYSLQTTRGINNGSEYYGIRSVADKKFRYIVNLTPEAEFINAVTIGPLFRKWLSISENDPAAAAITLRYQKRPGTELYDVENDRYCLNNLAEDARYAEVIARMDKALREWMTLCGDKGQETEMEALFHQPRNTGREN